MPVTSPVFARLLAVHTDVEQPEYLLENGVYAIGRLQGVCAIVINRTAISRIHAQVEQRGSLFFLRDLSRNGTFVNGKRIEGEYTLLNEDKIGLATPEPLLIFADSDPTVVHVEALRYDETTVSFYLHDQPLELTPTLLRLLHYLYRHRGQLCTRDECAKATWQEDYLPEYAADNLDKAIFALRQRLRKIDPNTEYIQSRRGLGFLLTF
ncbi:MAG: FHA domain-containing protein [Caldilinea sp. CFX5]|nr:FHA domain-containing protein [Caldilinea sp. CFX5]